MPINPPPRFPRPPAPKPLPQGAYPAALLRHQMHQILNGASNLGVVVLSPEPEPPRQCPGCGAWDRRKTLAGVEHCGYCDRVIPTMRQF